MKELITNHKALIITAAAALAVAGGTGAIIMGAQQPAPTKSETTTSQPAGVDSLTPTDVQSLADPAPQTSATAGPAAPTTSASAPSTPATGAQTAPAPTSSAPAPQATPQQPVVNHFQTAPTTPVPMAPAPAPGGGTASSTDGPHSASSTGSN